MKKFEETYLYEYYNKIRDGDIIAGSELKQELERLIEDARSRDYVYDTTDADRRIDFIENCIRLTKSPYYGKPMKLMLWQKAFIETLYSFKMPDGTDRFRRAILLIARKNCKSETCSALITAEMIIGAPGADIVCSSNDDSQANILYDAVDIMRLMIDPEQKDTWRNQRCIRNKINGSKIFKLSDRTKNKEGRNVDFSVIDEIHEMKAPDIVKAIEQSQSLKPNPKLIMITTEGFVNGGFLDEELIRARKILSGEETGPAAERYLPWLYTQDSEQEVWSDPSTWTKSNPTLGVVKRWDYLEEQIDKARNSKSERMFVLSKDFNIKMGSSQAWLKAEDLSYDRSYDPEELKGKLAVVGVDLSETTDLTCCQILIVNSLTGEKYVKSMYWIPEGKLERASDIEAGAKYKEWAKAGLIRITPGNENDVSEVADYLAEVYKKDGIRILRVGYDQRFSKDFIKRLDEYGFEYEFINQNRYTLSQPMKILEADIISKKLLDNNNPVNAWCFGNTSVKMWDDGNILPIKIQGQPARRIDGTAALLDAYEIYRRYRSDYIDHAS